MKYLDMTGLTHFFEKMVSLLIKNLEDGSYNQSLRQTSSAAEDANYRMGAYAVALGSGTKASGLASHAEGEYTTAAGRAQHVSGQYNVADPAGPAYNVRGTYVEIVGNGTADDSRSNARTLDWEGNEVLAGKLTAGGGSAILGAEETASDYGFNAVSLRMNSGEHEDPVLVGYGGNQYGIGVLLEGQGTTIVASGEAGKNIVLNDVNSAQAGNNESLHLASDSNTYIYSNCNTIADRKQMTFDTDGNLTVPGQVKQADPVNLCSWGTYSAANTTVSLREDYTNYRFLILRFGTDPSSGQIGGISLMTIPTSMIGSAALFQHEWYQGTALQSMVFSFPTATTLKIVTRSGSSSGLRQIYGYN